VNRTRKLLKLQGLFPSANDDAARACPLCQRAYDPPLPPDFALKAHALLDWILQLQQTVDEVKRAAEEVVL
jgi:hypothetical protein